MAADLVLVVAVPDDPPVGRRDRAGGGDRGSDVVEAADRRGGQIDLVEARAEPGHVLVGVVEARHDAPAAEGHRALCGQSRSRPGRRAGSGRRAGPRPQPVAAPDPSGAIVSTVASVSRRSATGPLMAVAPALRWRASRTGPGTSRSTATGWPDPSALTTTARPWATGHVGAPGSGHGAAVSPGGAGPSQPNSDHLHSHHARGGHRRGELHGGGADHVTDVLVPLGQVGPAVPELLRRGPTGPARRAPRTGSCA